MSSTPGMSGFGGNNTNQSNVTPGGPEEEEKGTSQNNDIGEDYTKLWDAPSFTESTPGSTPGNPNEESKGQTPGGPTKSMPFAQSNSTVGTPGEPYSKMGSNPFGPTPGEPTDTPGEPRKDSFNNIFDNNLNGTPAQE